MTFPRFLSTTLALAATLLAPGAARAQSATQSGAPAATTSPAANGVSAAEVALKQMASKLQKMLAAQEQHYSDHGTYTTSMTAIQKYDVTFSQASSIKRRDSVSVQVIFAGGRGWTGIASHWGLRGRSCVVYVGMIEELPKLPITRADRRTPTEEGVPACDSPPASAAGSAPLPAPVTSAPTPARQ